MNQAQFWEGFKHDPAIRQAHIYHALHYGPDPVVWGKNAVTPTYYNELALLALLEVFDRHPTRKAAMQLGVFIFARSKTLNNEMWLVDPANRESQARKMVGMMVQKATNDYQVKRGAMTGSIKIASASKAIYLSNMFDRVRQELCNGNGVLSQYLANIGTLMGAPGGDLTNSMLVAARYKRLDGINRVAGKAKWLNDLVSKLAGTGTISAKIGQTFDPSAVGLSGGERFAHLAFPVGVPKKK